MIVLCSALLCGRHRNSFLYPPRSKIRLRRNGESRGLNTGIEGFPRPRRSVALRGATWIPASAGMTRTGWRVSLRSTRPTMTRMWSWGVQRGEALCERLEASHPLLSPLPSRERTAHVELQEGTSCRGFGGVPQSSLFFPQDRRSASGGMGVRGLIDGASGVRSLDAMS